MDSISIKVPVTVKAKLTEKLRKRIVDDLTHKIQNVELEMQQMGIQEKRIVEENAENLQRVQMIREQFAVERQKRLNFKAKAEKELEDTKKLALGAEIVQGNLERQVELRVGDNMREIMNVEILVEDDKIIAIRG